MGIGILQHIKHGAQCYKDATIPIQQFINTMEPEE